MFHKSAMAHMRTAVGNRQTLFRSFCCKPLSAAPVSNNFKLCRSTNHNLSFIKSLSSDNVVPRMYCEQLKHRGLIHISGSDVVKFLQGLITNDMQLLDKSPAIYAMMLNSQGRVLYDLIVYKRDECSYFVECDLECSSKIIAALRRYKLRNKVTLDDVNDEYVVWSLFSESLTSPPSAFIGSRDVTIQTRDPRLASLGTRVILKQGLDGVKAVGGQCEQSPENSYRLKLCRVGIGEGTVDFPPEMCFPLECNLAFLNGVSFNKGCYVGQELTARTHHTGVIRKRLLPLLLSNVKQQVSANSTVVNRAGKECGKVRTVCGSHALGLLRVADVVGTGSLSVKTDGVVVAEACTSVPSWWPTHSDFVIQQTVLKDKDLKSNTEQ